MLHISLLRANCLSATTESAIVDRPKLGALFPVCSVVIFSPLRLLMPRSSLALLFTKPRREMELTLISDYHGLIGINRMTDPAKKELI